MDILKGPIDHWLKHIVRTLIVLLIIGAGFVFTVATGGSGGSSGSTESSSISASAD